ncbi:MAG: heavy metal translocating P-type ATPase [Lachnospiraceae bacterium]|jgi:Cd2+/Zn2+-exporting ATPase|nr:heavy metal translocating P-type ATPase [Lachnospiraceae bacterium]
MSKKLKKRIRKTEIAAVVFLLGLLIKGLEKLGMQIPYSDYIAFGFFFASYLISGIDVIKSAVLNIGHGQLFDETFLMAVASIGAFFVGSFSEAAAVMLFYQVGECFQSYAVGKSRKSITDLMNIRPDVAFVIRDGETVEVDPEEVALGETITIKPGERIPLDAVVLEGTSLIDTMALTGEPVPRRVEPGDEIISGCVNQNGVLTAKVTKNFAESTVTKILDLVENSNERKAPVESFLTKFSKIYTPFVVFTALFIAIVPSIVTGDVAKWVYTALSLLVISCPCAFLVSVPLTFFGGLGATSRAGILVKGGNYLDALGRSEIVVMDKTGTLTKGSFSVQEVILASEETAANEAAQKAQILRKAALLEQYSNHPIAVSIVTAFEAEVGQSVKAASEGTSIEAVQEVAGKGITAVLDGQKVYAGNAGLMSLQGIQIPATVQEGLKGQIGSFVHVAVESTYLGCIRIADEIKDDAKEAVKGLYDEAGIRKIVMLTGDQKDNAEIIARELGIKDYQAELLPGDKVDRVEALLQETSKKGNLIFVGDGINDAPVLARADIGFAMGGIGSDAAIEAADVVIMDDKPSKIAQAIRIARKTVAIANQNSIFAIGVKLAIMVLTILGITSMWAAILADVGVMVLCVLNAMRALKLK